MCDVDDQHAFIITIPHHRVRSVAYVVYGDLIPKQTGRATEMSGYGDHVQEVVWMGDVHYLHSRTANHCVRPVAYVVHGYVPHVKVLQTMGVSIESGHGDGVVWMCNVCNVHARRAAGKRVRPVAYAMYGDIQFPI